MRGVAAFVAVHMTLFDFDREPPLFDPSYERELKLDSLTRRVLAVEGFAVIPPSEPKWCILECGRCEINTRHNLYPKVWVCAECGFERVAPTEASINKLVEDIG